MIFKISKLVFITLLGFTRSFLKKIKCTLTRPTDLIHDELHHYPIQLSLYKCDESCNIFVNSSAMILDL